MRGWKGGDCPLSPGTPYEARHRDGTMIEGENPELEVWSWEGKPWDIVSYRAKHWDDRPSIRTAATLAGKSPSTVCRWKRTNPHLYRAVMEYAERHSQNQLATIRQTRHHVGTPTEESEL